MTSTWTHRVVPEGSGCRTTLEMAGPLPVLLGYAPLARLALGRLVRPQFSAAARLVPGVGVRALLHYPVGVPWDVPRLVCWQGPPDFESGQAT